MPKALREYGMHDWIRLRPLTHAIKTRRYRAIDRSHLAQTPHTSQLGAIHKLIHARQVVVVIAYNDAEAIRWQSKLMKRYLSHALYVVIDNSTHPETADTIQRHCESASIPYVRVPLNPWSGRNASRSHGFAMNWTWRHVLLPSEPHQFGFIDHDLFPTSHADPFQNLETCCCYGDKRWAGTRWFLWAGFCFFDFSSVAQLPLDFGLDWFAGLDTGGANWQTIYQHLDHQKIQDRPIRHIPVWPNVSLSDAYFEWRGDWLHEVGLDGRMELKPQKRQALASLLAI